MFDGTCRKSYELDNKGRVRCPNAVKGSRVYVMIKPEHEKRDRCLLCMDEPKFLEAYSKMIALTENEPGYKIARHQISSTVELIADGTGKILIPLYLREYAGLQNSILFCPCSDGMEIWAEERFNAKFDADMDDPVAHTEYRAAMYGETKAILETITTVDAKLELRRKELELMMIEKELKAYRSEKIEGGESPEDGALTDEDEPV